VEKYVECLERGKPRMQCSDQQKLDSVLVTGTALQDNITDEISDDHILRHAFV